MLPKAALEVRRVEEWRQDTAPIAFYNQPALDGSRPGIYYVNLKDMAGKQKHEMETIAYHEGAPGHHFQIAIQQELEGVPTFQKFAYFGSYVEGWGLYAERLAKEEGGSPTRSRTSAGCRTRCCARRGSSSTPAPTRRSGRASR